MARNNADKPAAAPGANGHSWTEGVPHDFTGWGPQTPDRPYSAPERDPEMWVQQHLIQTRSGDERGSRGGVAFDAQMHDAPAIGPGGFGVRWGADAWHWGPRAPDRSWRSDMQGFGDSGIASASVSPPRGH